MAWSLEESVLEQVIDTLGVILPVHVVKHQGGSSLLGTHQLKDASEAPASRSIKTNYYHHVSIGSKLSPWRASRVVWHELAHAKQSEVEMKVSKQKFDSLRSAQAYWRVTENAPDEYLNDPFEIEARRYEDYAEYMAACI